MATSSGVGASSRRQLLLGREHELEAIERALGEAAAGRGSTLVLEGAAGIGKTALTRAAAERAAAAGLDCLSARGNEREANLPFGVVRQLFERPLHRDERLRQGVLTGSATLAGPVLSLPGGEPAATADPYAVLHGLFWVCSNLAERTPLLIVVDDLHCADPASIRFLTYLAHRADDLPVLLLLTYRTGEPVDRAQFDPLLGGTDSEVIGLAPLGEEEAAVLIRAECGEHAADEFCRACHTATGGNPFLLRELARSLADERIAPTPVSVERIAGITPAAVIRSVGARLGRLPASARALARGIAVVEPRGDQRLAALVADLAVEEAAAAADALAAAGLITGTGRLEFVHPLIRTAIYEQLGPGARVQAHSVAADAIAAGGGAPEHAAMHLVHVPPAQDAGRVAILVKAAEAAVGRGAPETAVEYLLRALDEPPPYGERGKVLFELGRAEAMLAANESLGHLSQAVELATELEDKIAILRETAYAAAVNFGLFPVAHEMLTAARALAADRDADLELLLRAEQETWVVMNDDPPLAARLPELERAGGALTGATLGERAMLAVLAWARMGQARPLPEVTAAAAAALADGRLVAALGSASLTVGVASWSLAHTLARAELEPLLPLHLRVARQAGSRHGIGVYVWASGVLAYLAGRLRDAEAFLREGVDALVEVNSIGAPPLLATYIDILRSRGETDAAWRELELLGYAGELPPFHAFAPLRMSRGRLRAARGDLDGGLADLLAGGEQFRRWGMISPAYATWRYSAAELHQRRGEVVRATELIEEELELARRAQLPYAVGRALRVYARCEAGPAGIERLREAVDTLERTDARVEHAHALIDLGAALRRANRRGERRAELEEARRCLREGVEIAHRCGATPLAEQGQVELRATGARPRRLVARGPDALTASERRVAQMAAEGMSNREVAEALFVTLKTVEKHLGNAYVKLGIASRHQLQEALTQ